MTEAAFMHEQKCLLHSAFGWSSQSPTTNGETTRAARSYENDSMTRSFYLNVGIHLFGYLN